MPSSLPSLHQYYLVQVIRVYFGRVSPILIEEKEIQQARLLLVYGVKIVLKTGLALPGIEAPDKM
jgi:arginyl-tRNA synthetase